MAGEKERFSHYLRNNLELDPASIYIAPQLDEQGRYNCSGKDGDQVIKVTFSRITDTNYQIFVKYPKTEDMPSTMESPGMLDLKTGFVEDLQAPILVKPNVVHPLVQEMLNQNEGPQTYPKATPVPEEPVPPKANVVPEPAPPKAEVVEEPKVKKLSSPAKSGVSELSFSNYMKKELQLHDVIIPERPNKAGDYNCSGLDKNNKNVAVTFDAGTRRDGEYNIFITRPGEKTKKLGLINPPGSLNESEKNDSGKECMDLPEKETPKPKKESPPKEFKSDGRYTLCKYIAHGEEAEKLKSRFPSHRRNSSSLEVGYIVMTDPDGRIVGEYPYGSGPYAKGHIPYRESYTLADNIRPFVCEGSNVVMPGLRIPDANFKGTGRGGILLHEDREGWKKDNDGNFVLNKKGQKVAEAPGTIGCVGMPPKAWKEFEEDYRDIPANKRPRKMESLDSSEYKRLKTRSAGVIAGEAVGNSLSACRMEDEQQKHEKPDAQALAQQLAQNDIRLQEARDLSQQQNLPGKQSGQGVSIV